MESPKYDVVRLPELQLTESYINMLEFNIKSMLDNTMWSMFSHELYSYAKVVQEKVALLRSAYVNEIKFPL